MFQLFGPVTELLCYSNTRNAIFYFKAFYIFSYKFFLFSINYKGMMSYTMGAPTYLLNHPTSGLGQRVHLHNFDQLNYFLGGISAKTRKFEHTTILHHHTVCPFKAIPFLIPKTSKCTNFMAGSLFSHSLV